MRFLKNNQDNSKNVAKKRLLDLLSYEKHNISKELLDLIKSELINSVEDYFEINREACELFITEEENEESAVIAIMPISNSKK